MCVLDDVCATMHAVSEGADATLLEVWYFLKQDCTISCVTTLRYSNQLITYEPMIDFGQALWVN